MSASPPPLPDWVPEFRPRPPWWGGHLQTLSQKLGSPGDLSTRFANKDYILPLDDGTGDSLVATLYDPADTWSDRVKHLPIVVLLHGLGGTSQSTYIQSSADFLLRHGHRVLLVDFRGAGESASECRRLHHPGRTEDIARLLEAADSETERKLQQAGVVLVGYSLGGSVLLKFLAESSVATSDPTMTAALDDEDNRPAGSAMGILGAITVSAPLDLEATSKCLARPSRWIYQLYLLDRMREQALADDADVSDEEREAIREAASVWEFDTCFTAPRCGFDTVEEYYRENSAGPTLAQIDVPTALVYALDDPFVPASQYLETDWSGLPRMQPIIAPTGGHVGFRAKGLDDGWHNHCIDRFVRQLVDAPDDSAHSVSRATS